MKRTSLSIAGISTLLIAASLTAARCGHGDEDPTTHGDERASGVFQLLGFSRYELPVGLVRHYDLRHRRRGRDLAESRGTPYNGSLPAGAEYLIQKNSNRALWNPANNAVNQSNIGIKGKEEFALGWAFIFDLQANFNPYSLQLSNGPKSVAQNAGVPLTNQSSNGDSSQAGQFYNGLGFVGVSSPYGTLTVFRQNTLRVDAIVAL
jgi:hypothetical protein